MAIQKQFGVVHFRRIKFISVNFSKLVLQIFLYKNAEDNRKTYIILKPI